MSHRIRIVALIGVSALALPGHAAAQDGPKAPDAPASQGIQEIVVTANRTQSTAQKTAVALTVYSGSELGQKGVSNVIALGSIDPSVNVTTSTGASYIAIRGIASTDVTETGDPSVPIARDDFFTNRSFSIGTSMYDLARVEVLKGPQGTLFGRNSTGGLIDIVTNKPGKTLGADIALDIGNYQAIKAEAAVNIPITDKVQMRVSGFTSNHEGYRKLDVIGGRGDDDNTKSGRVQLAFQPFEGFDGLIQYQHDDINDIGDVAEKRALGVGHMGSSHEFPNYEPSYNRLKGDRVTWRFDEHFGNGMTLYYQGGYDEQHWRHQLDASSIDPATGAGTGLAVYRQAENPATWNHEVRLSLPQDGRLTGQIGYFHFSEHNGNLDSGLYKGDGPYDGQPLIHFLYDVHTRSDGVFGQFAYKIVDTVKLTGGARYNWDQKTRTGNAFLRCDIAGIPSFVWPFVGCNGTPPLLTTPGNGNISEHKPTFHAGLDWQPTPRNLVYAKFDTGYKSGGFNSNGSAPSIDYGPEWGQAWEIGSKNKFLGNHVLFDVDGFYQLFNGYQASQQTAVISGSASGVFNIGSAKIYGAEAQLVAAANGWRFDANATWLHARFTSETAPIVKGDGATLVNVVGKQMPNAPSFVATAGLEYAIELPGATVTPRIEGKASAHYYFDPFNDADTRQNAFGTLNASLNIKPTSMPLNVLLYVRNLTNKTVFANAAENYVTAPFPTSTYEFQPPRTYGVRVSAKF